MNIQKILKNVIVAAAANMVIAMVASAATISINGAPAKDIGLNTTGTITFDGLGLLSENPDLALNPGAVGGSTKFTFNQNVMQLTSVALNTAVFDSPFNTPADNPFTPEDEFQAAIDAANATGVFDFGVATNTTQFGTPTAVDFLLATVGFITTGTGTSDMMLAQGTCGSCQTWTDALNVAIPNLTFNGASITVVPIPAAIWLLGSGLIGLIGMSRRKNNLKL